MRGLFSSDREQVEDYALCLRDFHSGSAGKLVVPILCADEAERRSVPNSIESKDNVAETIFANAVSLSDVLRTLSDFVGEKASQIDWNEFDQAGYNWPAPRKLGRNEVESVA